MRVIIDEDLETYRSEVRRFMDNVLRPLLTEYDLTQPLTKADLVAIRQVVQTHEIARSAPERPDGTVDLMAAGIFTEEINRVDASIGSVAAAVFFPLNDMIRKVFAEEQVARYPHLMEPGRMIAISTSEPDTGSDASGIKTTATQVGENWIINGRKLWTSNGAVADALLVSCKVKDRAGETALFVVDLEEHPLDMREVPVIGMNGVSTCEVVYDNVVLPKEACIGRLGTLLGLISHNRVTIALSSVGIAQGAYELAEEYAKARIQFGRPIAAFQLVQEMIVDMATEIEAGRLLAYRALALLERGRSARAESAMAKWWCTEMAQRVTSTAMQVHGGIGLTREYPAERYFRDARIKTIGAGTTQIQKLTIGREILGISAMK
jgi:alkylation response protein AidB-like acyl-CoA dehydrogenase